MRLAIVAAILCSGCSTIRVQTADYTVEVSRGPFVDRKTRLEAVDGRLVHLEVEEKTDNAGLTAAGGIVATVASWMMSR